PRSQYTFISLHTARPLIPRLCSAHLLAPHSFPTRRSSDLFRSIVPMWDNTARYAADAYVVHGSTPQKFQEWLHSLINYSKVNLADRKSTRLNSSHVKISYAVFCLKKKNTR